MSTILKTIAERQIDVAEMISEYFRTSVSANIYLFNVIYQKGGDIEVSVRCALHIDKDGDIIKSRELSLTVIYSAAQVFYRIDSYYRIAAGGYVECGLGRIRKDRFVYYINEMIKYAAKKMRKAAGGTLSGEFCIGQYDPRYVEYLPVIDSINIQEFSL